MNKQFLPGNVNDRVRELRERDGMTQAELAARLGVSPSTLGRIEKGEIRTVNSDLLVRLARVFGVTTDFLLGITNSPERTDTDIEALGLSAEVARRLRSGAVNKEALNGMIASRYFPAMTQSMAAYAQGTMSEGIRLHNNILATAMGALGDHSEAKTEISAARIPGAIEQENIVAQLRYVLRDMREHAGQNGAPENADRDMLVAEAVMKDIFGKAKRGETVTPEDIANTVLGKVEEACGLEPHSLDGFREPIIALCRKGPPERRQK